MLTIMTAYEIATVLVGIFGLAFTIWAIWVKIKYGKMEKEQRDQKTHQQNIDKEHRILKYEIQENMRSTIREAVLESLEEYTTKREFENFKDLTNAEIMKIHEAFDSCYKELLQIQKASLRMELNNFINEVLKGEPKTREHFSNMATIYDKYQRLGGNSYITALWPQMKEKLKEQWKKGEE